MSVSLFDRISRYIDDPASGSFEELALELFTRHYECNPAFRLYSDRMGKTPENVSDWKDIPAVPSTVFKSVELSCVPASQCETVFYSSGTTRKLAGKHWMDRDALALYERSLLSGYRRAVRSVYGEQRLWAMMPSIYDAPHSSLSHMLFTLRAEKWQWDEWRFLSDALDKLTGPLELFGTGFAFVALFDAFPGKRWPLPLGSVVINTGGFKGRTREVDHGEFYAMLRERFGVDDRHCVAEYGMSEMASQFYSVGENGLFEGPHWLRTRLIDPETGEACAPGRTGALCHYDLANWNSVLAIQTQDGAVCSESSSNGSSPFRLIGRMEGAEIRGCSLTVEELWGKQR